MSITPLICQICPKFLLNITQASKSNSRASEIVWIWIQDKGVDLDLDLDSGCLDLHITGADYYSDWIFQLYKL